MLDRVPRFALMAAFWVVQPIVATLIWLALSISGSTTQNLLRELAELVTLAEYWIAVGIVGAVMAALQTLLLWPVRKPRVTRHGWSLRLSAAAAGLCGAMLLLGLVFALGSLVSQLDEALMKGLVAAVDGRNVQWLALALLAVGWVVATPLLLAFCRRGGDVESRLSMLASRLFMGTVIEAAAVIPLDVMVRRKTDCYCSTGTFWALTMCLGVGTIVAGPAILLPIVARRRRAWYGARCPACFYDMTGLTGRDRCPECGAGWRPTGPQGVGPTAGRPDAPGPGE